MARYMPECALLTALDLRGDDRPPMDQQRAFPEELPIRPLVLKENDDQTGLNEREPFVRHVLHVRVAGDYCPATIGNKALHPWDIVFRAVVVISRLWRVV